MRIGIGYDSHRFDGSGPLRLGGVALPSARGLSRHSDADVLLHALTDALLGAIGAPDIGEQFPPGDTRLRGIDSRVFVERALSQVRAAGFAVGNVDAVVVADSPKLAPHKAALKRSIGTLLGIDPSRVSVKGKTSEGFDPKDAGMTAQVVVLLVARKRERAAAKRKPSPLRRKQ